ncbi:MAG: hypothetical protein JW993_01185 [Sedimentisphaerales bacterium]|nr:hypothetical protein [Sedimentisphaerales bacterium]
MRRRRLATLAVLVMAAGAIVPSAASERPTEPPEMVGQKPQPGFFVEALGPAVEPKPLAATALAPRAPQTTQYVEVPTICVIYTSYYHNADCQVRLTESQVAEVVGQIEEARKFFWRASRLKFDMKTDFLIVGDDPDERTLTPEQMWDWGNGGYWLPFWRCDNVHSVEDDLRAAGIVNGQYAVVLVSYAFVNCETAYAPIGGGTYGPDMGCMGNAAYIANPMAWGLEVEQVTEHEYLHAIDAIFQGSGNPMGNDMFHADRARDFPYAVDCGQEFNFMICHILDPNSWLMLHPNWARVRTAPDEDEDGVPDTGSAPITEATLGTSPNDVDSDDDGLSDLDEMFAAYHDASNPLVPDTDKDGLADGDDVHPLWNCSEVVNRGVPNVDGIILPGEYARTVEYQIHNVDLSATVYTSWSDGVLYVAADVGDEMLGLYYDEPWWVDNFQIRIDAQKDGWEFFHGNQNYRFYVVPRGQRGRAEVFAHNYYEDEPNDPWHPLDTAAVTARYTLHEVGYMIEMAIPQSVVPGVTFAAGESIRLTFYVEDFDEWPGWPSVNLMTRLDNDRPGFVTLTLRE